MAARRAKGGSARSQPAARPEDALQATLAVAQSKLGIELTEAQRIIGEAETFPAWCNRLGDEGLEVDGVPFDLKRRAAMAWLYAQIPSTKQEAHRRSLVMMKCAQVGFTVMEILAALYLGLKFGAVTVGLFVPNQNGANHKSTNRFMPIVRSIPKVHALMVAPTEDSGQRLSEGSAGYRRFGKTQFVFSWTSGQTSTESIPMDFTLLDEVQEMTHAQIAKVRERMSASPYRFTLMGSTANWPDQDIHHEFMKGTQHVFHTICPTCQSSEPLVDYFPRCIKWDDNYQSPVMGRAPGAWRYVCPYDHWIDDPQQGEWIAKNPGAPVISVHFPQMLSPDISADEIMDKYRDARDDMKGFYNRVLGQPWLDPSETPVTMADLNRCAQLGKEAGLRWKKRSDGAYMGIDQMGTHSDVVVMERLENGKYAVIHLEEIYGDDSFLAFSAIIERFNVKVCTIEVNPNYLEAKKLATRHPGVVFVADSFGSADAKMIQWKDQWRLDSSDRRTSELARDRYRVGVHQYKAMSWALDGFKGEDPACLFPDPADLKQSMLINDRMQMGLITQRAFLHFTKTSLVTQQDEKTNQYKSYVKKQGLDPHFSYAYMLCRISLARAFGETTFILPEPPKKLRGAPSREPTDMELQLTPFIDFLNAIAPEGSCGRCISRPQDENGALPTGWLCEFINGRVTADQPGCGIGYVARS